MFLLRVLLYVIQWVYLVLVLPGTGEAFAAALGGLSTAFALVSNALQVRAFQSDIRRAGLLRSLLFIAWGNLLAAALAMALAAGGLADARAVLVAGFWPRLG